MNSYDGKHGAKEKQDKMFQGLICGQDHVLLWGHNGFINKIYKF